MKFGVFFFNFFLIFFLNEEHCKVPIPHKSGNFDK